MKNKTLVIGATSRPEKYSYLATELLLEKGFEVVPFGIRPGKIKDIEIVIDPLMIPDNIDTVTLYINPTIQSNYENFIIDIKPNRVIFNPGTENSILQNKLKENNIPFIEACTLVMIKTYQY